jgi:DNA-directed RNA polymerase subunit RPC12/RpoP
MPILYTCPDCGKQASATEDLAGQTVACAECGQTITIPALRPAPVEGPAEPPSGKGCGCGTIVISFLLLALLAALLLPAIGGSREAARRVHCYDKLCNISLALQQYHDAFKIFPAGAMHAGPAGDSARIGPSWWFSILPYCEQRNIYDKLLTLQRPGAPGNGAFNAENANAHIPGAPLNRLAPESMRCPASLLPVFENSTGPIVLPSYAAIAGGCDVAADSPDYQAVGGVARLVPNSTPKYYNRRKGVGHVPGGIITASGLLPPCEHVSITNCTDGTSNTMIVGEQSDWLRDVDPNSFLKYHGDAGWDTQGTGPAVASTTVGGGFLSGTTAFLPVPLANAGRPASPPSAYDCYNITTVRYPPHYKRVLGVSALPGCSEDHGINNPLQSAHPGGLQVAMADGRAQFISQTVDFAVFLRLAIRDDGQEVTLY